MTLFHIDRAWRDHLALIADVREGIHLVALGGRDPFSRFTTEIGAGIRAAGGQIETAVLDALERHPREWRPASIWGSDIKGPSSTWTYLVNDDPFRNQIGMMLTGPGEPRSPSARRRHDAVADPVGTGGSVRAPASAPLKQAIAEVPRGERRALLEPVTFSNHNCLAQAAKVL